MKPLYREDETAALLAWLDDRAGRALVTSVIGRLEVVGSVRRLGEVDPERVGDLLDGLDLVEMTPRVLSRAERIGDGGLGTLDAIHLASATEIADGLSALVCYDRRLFAAATASGLPTIAPA
ncbi:MAG: type II toxin-antitoxin system VapC family toxin [Acidimicrobiales bacterium]